VVAYPWLDLFVAGHYDKVFAVWLESKSILRNSTFMQE
jgi:hypothetical protein